MAEEVQTGVQNGGVITTESLQTKAERFGIPYITELPETFQKQFLKYVPEETAKTFRMFPYNFENGVLYVALEDPQNVQTLNTLRFLAEKENVEIQVALAAPKTITDSLRQYLGTSKKEPAHREGFSETSTT